MGLQQGQDAQDVRGAQEREILHLCQLLRDGRQGLLSLFGAFFIHLLCLVDRLGLRGPSRGFVESAIEGDSARIGGSH